VSDRSALLIGVPFCDRDLFPALAEVVAADVARMREALGQSGYEVRHCGVGDVSGQEPTGNRIRAAMMKALREAPPGGVLLIYFSGHGVTVGGRSYLVPQDAYAGPDGPDPQGLVPLVPAGVENCPAQLVLLVADSCRDDGNSSLAVASSRDALPTPPRGALVMFSSCGPGERSRYGRDGSYFTQALAEALDRRDPAKTLGEVHSSVGRRLARKLPRIDGVTQTPQIRSTQGDLADGVREVEICRGDQVGEAWRRAVEDSPLWERSTLDDVEAHRLRALVLDLVDECAGRWRDASEYLTRETGVEDPWSAHDYPARVLAAVELLLPAALRLTGLELAALTAVPFLREAALGAGLRLAAEVQPANFARTFHDGPRSDLEITHAMHEHVCRRAEGLQRRGKVAARDALAMWLVHQWLAGRSSLRDDADVVALRDRLAAAVCGVDLTERECGSLLRTLTECVDADPDNQPLLDRLKLPSTDPRTRALAAVLWLAGVLAADTRRLPTVVVDHIGIGADLQPGAVRAAAVQARWKQDDKCLTLHAVCDQPALMAGLLDVVLRARRVRAELDSLALGPGLAADLPEQFSEAGLRAEAQDGVPVFDVPLQRFRLSDEKVRELLMGRQLYGEPELAIRELYQNALDACRYRDVRRRFLRRFLRRTGGATTDWAGTIVFRQGVDADGREFIECEDNGVGMNRETLMRTFADAGERFVYRAGFRAEQARWQDLDPPLRLIPNSQFGVGVFSYFMIAEEIHISTRPVAEDDHVERQAHGVRIASSGSLFQMTPSAGMPAGGTCVRLHLTGEDDHISVQQTLRWLLWVAEYRVEVTEHGSTPEVWEPEQLRYPGATAPPLRYGEDLWWVSGDGCLVADGIRTNERRHGLVVNLRGPHRPRFTVDRNRLREWDKQWVTGQVDASLPDLVRWPGLTLSWLWRVADTSAPLAEAIFIRLVEAGHEFPPEGDWNYGKPAPASTLGCLPLDRDLFTGEMLRPWMPAYRWPTTWRVGTWAGVASFPGVEQVAPAVRLDGFPTVRPMDAHVLAAVYDKNQWVGGSDMYGNPTVHGLLEALSDEEESPAARVRRLRRFAVTGLNLSAAREIPPVHHTFTRYESPVPGRTERAGLLTAVAAWAPPGEPPRRAVGGWLVAVSADLQIPLGEVLRRAGGLVPEDWIPPVTDCRHLADYVCTRNDLNLFAQQPSTYPTPPWIGPLVQPAHLLRVSSALGYPLEQVLERMDWFAPLGYEVAGRDRYPATLTSAEREALRYVETIGSELTKLHLLHVAARTESTLEETTAALRRLSESGILRLPSDIPHADVPVDKDELAILDQELRVQTRNENWTLATGWAAVRRLADQVGAITDAGFEKRLAECRRLLTLADPLRPVTMPEIIDVRMHTGTASIAEAVATYQAYFPESADLSALPATAFESTLRPFYNDRLALLGEDGTRSPAHQPEWKVEPGQIVNGALRTRQSIAAFLDHLEPYRAIGAPLPQLDDPARELLSQRPPDIHDHAMLLRIEDTEDEAHVDTITPLLLVQVSGKFGWTLTETDTRMARLEPIGLALAYRRDACPDRMVTWQDLLVLTEYLDGQEPAITGHVGLAHLQAAAAEIEEPVEQVRQRLRPYARMFDLALDEGTTG
jgi:Caspase domain